MPLGATVGGASGAELAEGDGVPARLGEAVISTSYYPLWVADGTRLESADALPEGPDNLIEHLGHRFARGMELLRARMPTPDELRTLELTPACRSFRCCISTTTQTAEHCRSQTTYTPPTARIRIRMVRARGGHMSEWPRNWD